MTHLVASMCGSRLGELQRRFAGQIGVAGCHLRELGVYQQADPRFTRHAPALYEVVRDDERELFVLVLELLREVELKDSADDLRGWTLAHVEAAVRGIAEVHSIWYGREEALRNEPWLGEVVGVAARASMDELWSEVLDYAAGEFPGWYSLPEQRLHQRILKSLPDWCRELEQMPRTLIHGDFNPRNLAFRRMPTGLRLCAWDWELAELQVPQRDLAELLAFVLSPDVLPSTVDSLVDLHRRELSRHGREDHRRGAVAARLPARAVRLPDQPPLAVPARPRLPPLRVPRTRARHGAEPDPHRGGRGARSSGAGPVRPPPRPGRSALMASLGISTWLRLDAFLAALALWLLLCPRWVPQAPGVQRTLWIKLSVFFLVVHATLGVIAVGGLWLKAAMAALAAVGSRELTLALFAPGDEQKPYRWLAMGGAVAIAVPPAPEVRSCRRWRWSSSRLPRFPSSCGAPPARGPLPAP